MCDHPEFESFVTVNKLEDSGRMSVDLRIQCKICAMPLRFLGLPMGLDLTGAAVSADGTEARLSALPLGQPIPNYEGLPSGFRIINRMPNQ